MSAVLVGDDFESLLFQSADDFRTEVVRGGTRAESDQSDATGRSELSLLDCCKAFHPMSAGSTFRYQACDELEARALMVPDDYG